MEIISLAGTAVLVLGIIGIIKGSVPQVRIANRKVAFLFLIAGIVLIRLGAPMSVPEDTPAPSPAVGSVQPERPETVPHYVAKVEDVSYSNVVRFTLHTVVEHPVDANELRRVGERLLEEAKAGRHVVKPFNAISIMFYDYEDYIGSGYTLGNVDFAPGGIWADAGQVSSGQYEKMAPTWTIRVKNWDMQLTPDEVAIWTAWQTLYDDKAEETSDLPEDDDIHEEIAEKFGLTVEDVREIVFKQIKWQFMDGTT